MFDPIFNFQLEIRVLTSKLRNEVLNEALTNTFQIFEWYGLSRWKPLVGPHAVCT